MSAPGREPDTQRVTKMPQRSGIDGGDIFYQYELVQRAWNAHTWDPLAGGMGDGGRSDLRGKSFFIEVSEDGLVVKVVTE